MVSKTGELVSNEDKSIFCVVAGISNVGVVSTVYVVAPKSNPVVPVVVMVCVVVVKSNPVVPVVSVVACGNEAKSNDGVGSTD